MSLQTQTRSVLEAAMGSPEGQLGVSTPENAAWLAPMSLALTSEGGIWSLDQENQRLQLFQGKKVTKEPQLDSPTYQDVVLLGADRIVLMNRLVAEELVVLDLEGKALERAKLFGVGLDKPGCAGAMESRDDGVWVTYYNCMARVLTAAGKKGSRRGPRTSSSIPMARERCSQAARRTGSRSVASIWMIPSSATAKPATATEAARIGCAPATMATRTIRRPRRRANAMPAR